MRRSARDIGCANVAASGLANILPSKCAHENVPERNGTQEVAVHGREYQGGHRDIVVHAFCQPAGCRYPSAKRAIFV